MKARFSPLVQNELTKLQKTDRKLLLRIQKQIALFEENPKHPSLRTHKLTGKIANLWSISINRSIRMVYVLPEGKNFALFVKIGTHEQVYKK